MLSLPTFQESGFSKPSQYLRFLLQSHSLSAIIGDAWEGVINLPDRDAQLGLPKDTLVNFFRRSPEPLRTDFYTWKDSPELKLKQSSNTYLARQKTWKEKYGVDNPAHASDFSDKIRKTSLKKYGVSYPSQSQEIQDKIRKTNLEKYGVENPSQLQSVQDKILKTNLEKYGVEHPAQLQEFKEKARDSSLRKYGVNYPAQSSEIRGRIQKTNLKKYGVSVVTKSPAIKDKIRKTNLEKYGVLAATQLPETQEKTRQTNLSRYGSEHPSQLPEFQDKAAKTNLSRYGVSNFSKSIQRKISRNQFWISKLQEDFLDWKSVLGPDFLNLKISFTSRANQLNVPPSSLLQLYYRCCPDFAVFMKSEAYQKAFCSISSLELSLNKSFSDRSPVLSHPLPSSRQIDLYFPAYKVGFEFNGYRWHSQMYGRPTDYHKDKTSEALSQGIRLYHLWYQETSPLVLESFQNFINSRLGVFDVSISAGSTSCRLISSEEAQIFHKSYHIHGSPILMNHTSFGLFHHGNLVSVMTWRIKGGIADNTRYTVKTGYRVKFGFRKLMIHAVSYLKSQGIFQLITYCDRDLSPDPDNTVYSRYGFSLTNRDNYPLHLSYYVSARVGSVPIGHYSRHTFMKHKLSNLGIILQEGETADSALSRAGVFPCWNSGTWKYVLDI